MDDELGDGFAEKLKWIEDSWKAAGDAVFQPYIDARRQPPEEVLEAFGSVFGASHNEVRRLIAYAARRQGSDFLSDYLPA